MVPQKTWRRRLCFCPWAPSKGRVAGREWEGAGGRGRGSGGWAEGDNRSDPGSHLELQEIRTLPLLLSPLSGLFAAPIWG